MKYRHQIYLQFKQSEVRISSPGRFRWKVIGKHWNNNRKMEAVFR